MRFLRRMLQWDPKKRASAKELLADPFLGLAAGSKSERKEKEEREENGVQDPTAKSGQTSQ